MKLSISLPDSMAAEVRELAHRTERPISWWVQRAWTIARKQFQNESNAKATQKKIDRGLRKLEGRLRSLYPNIDSVTLAKRAFKNID